MDSGALSKSGFTSEIKFDDHSEFELFLIKGNFFPASDSLEEPHPDSIFFSSKTEFATLLTGLYKKYRVIFKNCLFI